MSIDYARFDGDALVGNVDSKDAVHASEADDEPSCCREGTA
jgi:hypothetical protein